jgi:hypothetical protein
MSVGALESLLSGCELNFGDPRLPSKFWARVSPEPNTGCWLWAGNVSKKGYGQFWWESHQQYAHRVALKSIAGAIPKSGQVDHRCGVRSCVNPEHLRVATGTENCRAAHTTRKGSSRFVGVSWYRRRGIWAAHGCIEKGKSVCLGYFASEVEAARAYDAFARAHYGEFARTNVDRGLLPPTELRESRTVVR